MDLLAVAEFVEFGYKSKFDPAPIRAFLGLDGRVGSDLPKEEKVRLANMLRRVGYLSDEDIKTLGMTVVTSS